MFFEAILAALGVAAISLTGALIFGGHRGLIGIERFVVPLAVGIFLSLVLYELIPETLASAPEWGGIAVAAGFIGFYLLAQFLHRHFHNLGDAECDRKSAASLLLIGDAVHIFAVGVILGGAFLINPAVGVATAVGLALHELPQEIVEFGVFIRAGYTRTQAALRNLLSASSIVVGTAVTLLLAAEGEAWLWVLTGIAAGNLLFLAASDLLPRIHGNLKNYGNIWYAAGTVTFGFVFMTIVLYYTHVSFPHGHDHHDEHGHELQAHDEAGAEVMHDLNAYEPLHDHALEQAADHTHDHDHAH
jgi:zinc and cadmium transporter